MFIVFEGIDGSGKSTQVGRLVETLQTKGLDVIHCRDPGSTTVGWHIREIVQNKELAPSPDTDLLLYTAARVELWTKTIQPALSDGKIVICDRFLDSTFAYQIRGKNRTQHEKAMLELHKQFIGYYPDMTFLIDVPVEVAAARLAARNVEPTRFETYASSFFQRVRDGYLEAAAMAPSFYTVVDGEGAEEEIAEQIAAQVDALLSEADAMSESVNS